MNGTSASIDKTYRDFLIHIEGNDGALTPCTDDAARALIAAPFRPTWHASQRGIVQAMRDRIDDIWKQAASSFKVLHLRCLPKDIKLTVRRATVDFRLTEVPMEKCERCLDLEIHSLGSRDVKNWMYPAPYSFQQSSVSAIQTVYACDACGTRWVRLKMKSNGEIHWKAR